jgi:hypothetical protein
MAVDTTQKIIPNPSENITAAGPIPLKQWVPCNTAMLIVHGIGNQDPMETIDAFGRGMLTQFGNTITVEHRVATKTDSNGTTWFDNYLRITKDGSEHYLDIYEYYWANYTRDLATYVDLSQWLNDVAKGANDFYFYDEDKAMGEAYGDQSIFFDKNGKFISWRYRFFTIVLPKFFMLWGFAKEALYKLIARIPLLGSWGAALLESAEDNFSHQLINIISEVTIYNTNDEKSRFYPIRCEIQDGAVAAVKNLVERERDGEMAYPRVLIAGHSLGSQVSFDALNRISLLMNKGQINNYDVNGIYQKDGPYKGRNITEQLHGLVTFGSPLDKIAFFLRMNVPPEQYLRDQMVNNYHGFKQQNWSVGRPVPPIKIQPAFVRLLDEMKWRNYHDAHDYVSGGLDYYKKVTNVNCRFPAKWYSFTHSNYWQCADFHQDIVREFF